METAWNVEWKCVISTVCSRMGRNGSPDVTSLEISNYAFFENERTIDESTCASTREQVSSQCPKLRLLYWMRVTHCI